MPCSILHSQHCAARCWHWDQGLQAGCKDSPRTSVHGQDVCRRVSAALGERSAQGRVGCCCTPMCSTHHRQPTQTAALVVPTPKAGDVYRRRARGARTHSPFPPPPPPFSSLCLQKIGFLLLLTEVCTYRTCRRKMPCPPTGVSPSTSTVGRRGRATGPGCQCQVSTWPPSCARDVPSPIRPWGQHPACVPHSGCTPTHVPGGGRGCEDHGGSVPCPYARRWAAVPCSTPSRRRRGARRCDVTGGDVSSLTRCDEDASDTAAERRSP